MQSLIRNAVLSTKATIERVLADTQLIADAERAAMLCIAALRQGNKILLAGNGGSAADSQHIAAELVSRLNYDRPGLSAIALTTDSSALTAIANDYGYEHVFARQLEAIGSKGDVLIAISTSGNSANIIAALQSARNKGIATIGLTGKTGGKMDGMCEVLLKIPSTSTPNIQECHIMFGHIICQMIEDTLFASTHHPERYTA
jgi:D-sedoheptulose 7-phosphate isomerase